MEQESMNLESQASLDYAERIARIAPERMDAVRTSQADRSARFHAARRVLEKLRAWLTDYAIYPLERLEECANEARERADAKARKAHKEDAKMNAKYNVWLLDGTWAISGNMPLDGCGVSLAEARREYRELVQEYGTGQLLILPAGLSITDHDEFDTLGGLYVVEAK